MCPCISPTIYPSFLPSQALRRRNRRGLSASSHPHHPMQSTPFAYRIDCYRLRCTRPLHFPAAVAESFLNHTPWTLHLRSHFTPYVCSSTICPIYLLTRSILVSHSSAVPLQYFFISSISLSWSHLFDPVRIANEALAGGQTVRHRTAPVCEGQTIDDL